MNNNDRGFALGPDPLPTQHYIDMRDAIIAGLKQDIATLQSQLQSVTTDRDFYEAVVTEAHEALDLWQGIDENHGVPERINIVRRHEALAGDQMEAAINALVAERDAARAWAAAWKRAAKMRRARVGYRQDVEWLCVDRRNRRARRAAEAAEAQERR